MSKKPKNTGKNKEVLPSGISMQDGNYRVRVYFKGKQVGIGTFDTLGIAKEAATIAKSEILREVFVPPRERNRLAREKLIKERTEALTLQEWAEIWLTDLATPTPDLPARSPGTITSYRSTLNLHVLPTLATKDLRDVTPQDIAKVSDAARVRSGKPSESVYRNTVRTLRAMFNAAVASNAGGLTVSPVSLKIRKPQATDITDEQVTATPAQVNAIVALMPKDLQLAVLLGAWCALRLGEVLGLQRQDFKDLDTPHLATIRVERQWLTKANPPMYAPPKAGSKRSMSIPSPLVPLIVEHLATVTAKAPDAPFFPSPRTPKQPVSQTQLDNRWRAARNQVKPGFRFHDLRHTGLTAYAQQGATVKEIMKRGGHSNVDVAMRYQDAARSRDRELTAKLGETLGL